MDPLSSMAGRDLLPQARELGRNCVQNLRDLETRGSCVNEVHSQLVRGKG